ncbi:hypothetical protein LSM04_003106 [Trypanosoma melophagium]|uniref:uncharacterized protein n=1 Tax=Trypanosoma melophagium TaxID=715481 RepID=UPI00351A8850|nr:hypothetical protein LSM04_003106 [Trypanosoma melophagium]
MRGGFFLGNLLARLVHGKQHEASGVRRDVAVFDAALTHTVRWYGVVGSVALAMTPLIYSTVRLLAKKRKTEIVRMASAISHSVGDVNTNVTESPSPSQLISLRPSFISTARVMLSARRILSAQHASDAEFADVFTNEIVGLYSEVVLRSLLRCFFCDCITHVGIFTLCSALNSLDGFMVGHSTYHVGVVHAAGVGQRLVSLLQRMWLQLRHDGLLGHTIEDVSTPYTFFIFSQSSCRMVERWLPWLGSIHYTALGYVDPCTYIEPYWRDTNRADSVWRVMTPKGFAVMWCCRSLPHLRQQALYPAAAAHNDGVVYTTPVGRPTHAENSNGDRGVAASSDGVVESDGGWLRVRIMLGIVRDFVIHTSKTSLVVFVLTSLASRSTFSWLPFKCNGGPQYVALCYAEILSVLWWGSLFVLRHAVKYSVHSDLARHVSHPT